MATQLIQEPFEYFGQGRFKDQPLLADGVIQSQLDGMEGLASQGDR